MGRVLLADLSDEELKAYLAHATFKNLPWRPWLIRPYWKPRSGKRAEGYAWIDRELDESICGLAVPVRDKNGATIAAINVSLPAGTFSESVAISEFLNELRKTASQLRAASM
ncbi:hypothetical protein LP414_12230 [Polaromonas sp. P1(28)-13]|nr:hypothetical protein LP414_12230 [Polaromonas sp. P1(28)-13]